MKISKDLDKLFNDLYEKYDVKYFDQIVEEANAYCFSDTVGEQGDFDRGFKLALLSFKRKKPVYKIRCFHWGNVYFISTKKDLIALFKKVTNEAKLFGE